MGYPVYEGVGTDWGGTTNNQITYYFPATVNSGDILILCLSMYLGSSITTPSGFTIIDSLTATQRTAWYWKRADGTEDGSSSYTTCNNGVGMKCSLMARFSGCVGSGTPHDAGTGTSSLITSKTSVPIPAATSSGSERLAFAFMASNDSEATQASSDDATDYSEIFDIKISGADGYFVGYTQQVGSGSISADSFTLNDNPYGYNKTIPLIGSSGYPNDVNGVASANIGKINGVATANIAKVNGA